MTDIVERLRGDARGSKAYHELSDEAADEIERLRADYQRVAAGHDLLHEERDDARRQVERLLAENAGVLSANAGLAILVERLGVAIKWSLGDVPDAEGKWFDDVEPPMFHGKPAAFGWRRHLRKLAFGDEQSALPEGDNDPNGNRDLAREIDGS